MQASWNWKKVGFKYEPRKTNAPSNMRLFRAWGGPSTKLGNPESVGVCFSTDQPQSRNQAEALFAVFEYGNNCVYLSEFSVQIGTELWIGSVDPGDPRPILGRSHGVQVFIENPAAQRLVVIRTSTLADDLKGAWVYTGNKMHRA
jgi:hypothetical protein